MKPLQKLGLSIIMGLGIYFILTMPHFIATITMDINTGHYYGYVYPFWLLMLMGIISGPLGRIILKLI